jgi:hypothetical protein
LLISIVPTALLNLQHAGYWTGIPRGDRHELHSPLWGVLGNCFCLPAQNLVPPIFPWAGQWNQAMVAFLSTPFGSHFNCFERFGYLRRSVTDGTAGLGLGICSLILLSFVIAVRRGRAAMVPVFSSPVHRRATAWLLRLVPWLLLLVFMAKVGTFTNARHLSPYYLLFLPLLLAMPVHSDLLRQIWWRRCGVAVMLVTAGLLVLSINRPLFPANTLIARLASSHPQSKMASHLREAYGFRSTFETLRDVFAQSIPPGESTVAYLTVVGFAEPGLALPLGRLQVERLRPTDSPAFARQQHIHYVVADDIALGVMHVTLETWLAQWDARLVDQVDYYTDPHLPPNHLYLACFN